MINIYGIYDKDVLLYVGSTDREVKERWNEHKRDLKKGTHSNKTLQKYFVKENLGIQDLDFKVVYSLPDEDNSLLKMTLEMMTISLLRPKCNKCCYQSGRTMMTFKRCDNKKICEGIIAAIVENSTIVTCG